MRKLTSKRSKNGYKIADSSRTRLIGVACESLRDLMDKGVAKLNLTPGSFVITLEDGTVVDDEDYFRTIPPQTVFVFQINKIATGADIILNALRGVNVEFLQAGAEIETLLSQKADEIMGLLHIPIDLHENSVHLSSKDDDPGWFENLDTNATTKEDYMRRKAQDRIRGYFYKFQDDVRRNPVYLQNPTTRKVLTECLSLFRQKLAEDQFFACFFDRRLIPNDATDSSESCKKLKIANVPIENYYSLSSFCDATGRFTCQGLWKANYCAYPIKHSINPYANRESRILFSTWNLDHRIEKSRTILPTILNASQEGRKVNFDYFYALLFTNFNLKIVHIVCHDKTIHDINCDKKLIYC